MSRHQPDTGNREMSHANAGYTYTGKRRWPHTGRSPPVKGGVRVMCVQEARMGRATNLVEIHPAMPMQPKPLYDARLSGMPTSEFVLSGFELFDGSAYAQA